MIAGFEIVQHFERHPTEPLTILQLSKKTGRSYGATYNAVRQLAEQGVLARASVGKSTLCSIDLANPTAVALLTCASLLRAANADRTLIDAATHLHSSALSIWHKDNAFYAIMRPHANATTAGGIPVHAITLRELLKITNDAICLWGAENFWRIAGGAA